MNPEIASCISSGFKIARKSVAGMAIYTAGLAIVLILSAGILLLTKPPLKSLVAVSKNRGRIQQQRILSKNETNTAVKSKTRELTPEEKEVTNWFKKVWPVFFPLGILLIFSAQFFKAAQIGFLAKMIRENQAGIKDFFAAGRRFWSLIAANMLLLGALSLPMLGGGLIVSISAILPKILAGILTFFAILTAIVFVIWLGVRLTFLNIAVIADQKSPIEAWRNSFHATSGRWWHVLGFGVVLGLLSFGAQIVMNLLNRIVGFATGNAATVLAIVVIFSTLVRVFMSFFQLSASIYYYDQTKKTGETVLGSN